MIAFQSASLRRGTKILFEDASLVIHAREKVGIIGTNGCGKSSLFQLLIGGLELDQGEVQYNPELKLAHSQQSIPDPQQSTLDYVLTGDKQLHHWQQKYQTALDHDDQTNITHAADQLDKLKAWEAEPRARQLLAGLGFKETDSTRPVGEFSGGWQMRLSLARALMMPSDILLLDEPTNHLDLDAILWLEQWLNQYEGTLLLISHDRMFLDQVTNKTLHFNNQQLRLYSGNYSAFEHQLAERIRLESAQQKKIQQQQKHLTAYIDRFRAKASKARQAQSRIKQLERLQDVTVTQLRNPYKFNFKATKNAPNPMIRLEQVSVGYDKQPVLENIDWMIHAGDRIGILGANGAGKSTVLRAITEELRPINGTCWISEKTKVGYFDQHQLNQLEPHSTVFDVLQRAFPEEREQQLLDYLGHYAFYGDMVKQHCGSLSGGEKSRLVLAMIMREEVNLLILDEPTNHLDLQAREALTLALQDFNGALLLVSHDRHLLETSCDQFRLVADGQATAFDGTVDDYAISVLNPAEKNSQTLSPGNKKQQRQAAAIKRQNLAPLHKKVNRLESQIDTIQGQLTTLENELASPDIYEDSAKERLKVVLLEQAGAQQQLAGLESDYFSALEELELAEKNLELSNQHS